MGSPIILSKKEYLKTLDVPAFLERPEVAAFVGKNFDKYKELWLKDYAKTKSALKMTNKLHWNWGAFWLWFSWFSYRRMWGVVLSILGLLAVSSMAEAYYYQLYGKGFSASTYTAPFIILSMMSKGLYFNHVATFFYKYSDVSPARMKELIEEQGGTSVRDCILGTVLSFVILIGAVYLGEIMFPSSVADATVPVSGTFKYEAI